MVAKPPPQIRWSTSQPRVPSTSSHPSIKSRGLVPDVRDNDGQEEDLDAPPPVKKRSPRWKMKAANLKKRMMPFFDVRKASSRKAGPSSIQTGRSSQLKPPIHEHDHMRTRRVKTYQPFQSSHIEAEMLVHRLRRSTSLKRSLHHPKPADPDLSQDFQGSLYLLESASE